MKATTDAARSTVEEKLRRRDSGEILSTNAERKSSQSAEKSPLFKAADELSEASSLLRMYVAAFEAFRGTREDCEEICEELRETKSTYNYWDRISRWMLGVAPTDLRPMTDDGTWPAELRPHVREFGSVHNRATKKVRMSLTQAGGGGGSPMPQADIDALWESIREDGRAMREAITKALRVSGGQADRYAEEVRTCVVKLEALLPQVSQDTNTTDTASGAKVSETKTTDLEDASSGKKNVSGSGSVMTGDLT
jgi:hypothetical protein